MRGIGGWINTFPLLSSSGVRFFAMFIFCSPSTKFLLLLG